jgi:transposase
MLGKTQTLRSNLVPRSGASERAERFFNKLKHFRAVATRYEKRDADYLALVKLAAIRRRFRFMSR